MTLRKSTSSTHIISGTRHIFAVHETVESYEEQAQDLLRRARYAYLRPTDDHRIFLLSSGLGPALDHQTEDLQFCGPSKANSRTM